MESRDSSSVSLVSGHIKIQDALIVLVIQYDYYSVQYVLYSIEGYG
jgi:hypothetical protein